MKTPKAVKELNARNNDALANSIETALRAALASLAYDGLVVPTKYSDAATVVRAAIARAVLDYNPRKE